jgi:hypothetical protein
MARGKSDAAQSNSGTKNPVASRTPEALRLSRSAEELAAAHETEEVIFSGQLANPLVPCGSSLAIRGAMILDF